MKQSDQKKDERPGQHCLRQACSACESCANMNYEERRPSLPVVKTLATQLYASEADHYDFFYALSKSYAV